eukprot:m51a1_g8032 hypothetical protein (518) ;mRNA; r:32873-35046
MPLASGEAHALEPRSAADSPGLPARVSALEASVALLGGLPAGLAAVQAALESLRAEQSARTAALESLVAELRIALVSSSARVQALETWYDALVCSSGAECAAGVCAEDVGICASATCDDRVRNGLETDVDCGGPGRCGACPDWAMCARGSDCASGVCAVPPEAALANDTNVTNDTSVANGTCAPPTCTDGVRNAGETDVDCGGQQCPERCADGKRCSGPADCASSSCRGGTCAAPACDDGARNGAETDDDCGGLCPGRCGDGRHCAAPEDCASAVCVQGVCRAATCSDGTRNGNEVEADCGGGWCPGCPAGTRCTADWDCESGRCVGGACAEQRTIRLSGDGYRQWTDGTYAASCELYRRPVDSRYLYAGDAGGGAYRIRVAGYVAETWCDMATQFLGGTPGGWTLAVLNSPWTVEPTPEWKEAVNNATFTGVLISGLTSFDYWLGVKYWHLIGRTVFLQMGSGPEAVVKQALFDFVMSEGDYYAIHLSNPRYNGDPAKPFWNDATTPYEWGAIWLK